MPTVFLFHHLQALNATLRHSPMHNIYAAFNAKFFHVCELPEQDLLSGAKASIACYLNS